MLALLAASTLAVSGAMAQILPTEFLGLRWVPYLCNKAHLTISFSPACQAAVIEVLTVGDFAVCFPAATVLPGK
jgi:hypothetical protein